jgi:hypothetical protein
MNPPEYALKHHQRRLLLVAAALLHMWASVSAQLLTATNASITITSGNTVTVEGGAHLNTATTINNQGALELSGDWNNSSGGTGIAPTSTGSVHLAGGLQSIGGSSVTDFRHLVISGGIKQLLQNVVVGNPGTPDGTVDLGAVLSLEGRTFTVFNPSSNAVVHSGGHVASENLNARFQWSMGNDLGEHRVLFGEPLGPAIPFAYTPTAPHASGTLLSIATYRTAPNNTTFPTTSHQQVLHMAGVSTPDNSANAADRFWLIDLPNGTFNGSILLSHAPVEDPGFGPGPIRAQRWIEGAGTWQNPSLPGQSNPGVREVLVPNVVFTDATAPGNEHIWALAYEGSPLPVELIQFDAVPTDTREVQCSWTTAVEIDNAFFTVERSTDGAFFAPVGTVPGAGNSHTTRNYELLDHAPYPGLSYYRLIQTDHDGAQRTSPMVAVYLRLAGPQVLAYPNPNNGHFTITREGADQAMPFELRDASGRLVRQWTMAEGVKQEDVVIGSASGLYTLVWDGGRLKVSVVR